VKKLKLEGLLPKSIRASSWGQDRADGAALLQKTLEKQRVGAPSLWRDRFLQHAFETGNFTRHHLRCVSRFMRYEI